MADEQAPERSIAPSDVTVTITVPGRTRGGQLRERLAGISGRSRTRTGLAFLVGLAALAAIIAIALPSSPTIQPAGASRAEQDAAQGVERAAIAAALGYPYPHRCLKITISADDPNYARANVERTSGCLRYDGYVNASLHRVRDTWRLVLDEGQLFVPNSHLRPVSARRKVAGYEYPVRCFSAVIVLHDPRFARADFDRTMCTRPRPG